MSFTAIDSLNHVNHVQHMTLYHHGRAIVACQLERLQDNEFRSLLSSEVIVMCLIVMFLKIRGVIFGQKYST
jgi:hypothetical protein